MTCGGAVGGGLLAGPTAERGPLVTALRTGSPARLLCPERFGERPRAALLDVPGDEQLFGRQRVGNVTHNGGRT